MQLCSLEEDNVDQNCGCRTVGHPEPECPDTHDTQVRGCTTVCVKATNDNWRSTLPLNELSLRYSNKNCRIISGSFKGGNGALVRPHLSVAHRVVVVVE